MKDYFDLWLPARDYAFAGETLKGVLVTLLLVSGFRCRRQFASA